MNCHAVWFAWRQGCVSGWFPWVTTDQVASTCTIPAALQSNEAIMNEMNYGLGCLDLSLNLSFTVVLVF